jgi:hypothetical protein
MTGGPAAGQAAPELLHGCVRCGAKIPLSESMCEACNPLGLRSPAASQAHGTVFVAIALAVVVLAVLARSALANVGPFTSQVTNVVPASGGLKVTIAITNTGSAAGRTTCSIMDPSLRGIGPETAYVSSPTVEGGATASFDLVVVTLGTTPKPLTVACGDQ